MSKVKESGSFKNGLGSPFNFSLTEDDIMGFLQPGEKEENVDFNHLIKKELQADSNEGVGGGTSKEVQRKKDKFYFA